MNNKTTLRSYCKLLSCLLIIFSMGLFSGCASTTLPWPDLSVSKDEADSALSKEEQDILEQLLSKEQETHRADAVKEIEKR